MLVEKPVKGLTCLEAKGLSFSEERRGEGRVGDVRGNSIGLLYISYISLSSSSLLRRSDSNPPLIENKYCIFLVAIHCLVLISRELFLVVEYLFRPKGD